MPAGLHLHRPGGSRIGGGLKSQGPFKGCERKFIPKGLQFVRRDGKRCNQRLTDETGQVPPYT